MLCCVNSKNSSFEETEKERKAYLPILKIIEFEHLAKNNGESNGFSFVLIKVIEMVKRSNTLCLFELEMWCGISE